MRFNLEQLKTADAKIIIDDVSIIAASTIFSDYRLQNAIFVNHGNFHLNLTLGKEDAENLITILSQHISNIKENELEIIAMQTKAAA